MSSADERERIDPYLWRLGGVVVLGTIMSILDTTIVNVAIESLGRELDSTLSTIQWVTTGYLLALATVIPLTGWSLERFGAKRMWMLSIVLFLIGSMLCGLAWNAGSLIAFRVLQGFGGGMIMPIGQAILAQAAGPQRMGRIMSVIGVPTLLGPVLGPVIGGLIVDNLSWRWIFFVNLPVGAVALVLASRVLPRSEPSATRPPLDVVGLLLLSPGLAALVYGLSEVGATGSFTATRVLAGLIAGVVLLTAFAVHALRAKGRSLIDLRLWGDTSFAAASATTFLFGAALFGAMFILPLYYQVVRGESALQAGLLLAPQGIGAAIAMPIAGRLTDRYGAGRVVPFGLVAAVVATIAYTQLTATTSYTLLAGSLFVRGIGLGLTFMPAMASAYFTLDRAAVPRATTGLNIVQRVGGSLGTAILTVVLERRIASGLGGGGGGSLDSIRSAGTSAAGGERARQIQETLAGAFGHTFWWALGMTALALIPVWFLPRRPPREAPGGGGPPLGATRREPDPEPAGAR